MSVAISRILASQLLSRDARFPMKRLLPLSLCSLLFPTISPAQKLSSEPGDPAHKADVQVTGHVVKPLELDAPDVAALRVSPGFRIQKFAENLGNARVLAIGPNGNVYVTRREQADVLMLKIGADGLASGTPVRVAGRPGLHGITFFKNKVYLATVHEVFTGEVLSSGEFGPLQMIIKDLPDAGQHNTRTIQTGPDEMLYISIGSTCNECVEPNQENAALLRASLDGKSRSIFATGLRDMIGWGWHPQTGELWGMDHGIDWLGDEQQPEELNLVQKGKRYGWPFVYGKDSINPHADPPGGVSKQDWARDSVPMTLGYTPHAAPMQMSFYNSTAFPKEFQGDAFISMRGSWNRKPPAGYEVLRIRFQNGQPVKMEPFVTGFLTAEGERGRLCGNVIAPDGSLLFSDDRNGVIYRVSYTGDANERAVTVAVPAEPMLRQNKVGIRQSLAIDSPETKAAAKLTVKGPFADGAAIPAVHSAYDQNVSPALTWSGAPAGTQSFALLMEDPDAKNMPLPVVHWIAWNIPADVTSLKESIPGADRLVIPKEMRQGANSAGVVGYRGPRPPEGDPPHHYHIQIFALDTKLDLPLGAGRDDLLKAMQRHVVASGKLVGAFVRPEKPAKP